MYSFTLFLMAILVMGSYTADGNLNVVLRSGNSKSGVAVKPGTNITLSCVFRTGDIISPNATVSIGSYNDTTSVLLNTWKYAEISWETNGKKGSVELGVIATSPRTLRCEIWQTGTGKPNVYSDYTLRIWRAQMEVIPKNITESIPVTVNCSVRWNNQPEITFIWYLDEVRLDEAYHKNSRIRNETGGTYNVTSSLTYTFSTEDNGKYLKCEARDKEDSILSDTGQTIETVLWDPEFTSDVTIQNTTTNTTTGEGGGFMGDRLYALFGVIGFLVVVALPLCICWVIRQRKNEVKRSASVKAKHDQERASYYAQRARTPFIRESRPVKTEGMIYAELEMVKENPADTQPPKTTPPQDIHGTENMVEYSSIAWDKNVIVG